MHEKQTWQSQKNHLYCAVYHLDQVRSVQLDTPSVPTVQPAHHSGKILGYSVLPYQKLRNWDGTYRDYYLIDLETGEAELILEKQRFGATLSPGGTWAAGFDGHEGNIRQPEAGMVRKHKSLYDTHITA